MRIRHDGGSARTRALIALVAASVALTTAGCDLRLEADTIVYPSPDAVTVARDTLADAESAVLTAADTAGASADDVAAEASATAQAHLDALGGVYVAYPDTTPEPTASATPAPTLSEAIDEARAIAEEVAASNLDPGLAFLARSIDLDWALREQWATIVPADTADDADDSDNAGTSDTAGTSDETTYFPLANGSTADSAGFAPSAATTGLSEDALSDLALREDEARFTYETIAALEFDSLRDVALARARLHEERSDALASLLTSDPRTPLYQLRDANLPDPDSRDALQRSVETDLGARYAALLDGAYAADAAWLLNSAFDSYARAMATAGFEASDLPQLPGLKTAA